jgi:hypothetical protein
MFKLGEWTGAIINNFNCNLIDSEAKLLVKELPKCYAEKISDCQGTF